MNLLIGVKMKNQYELTNLPKQEKSVIGEQRSSELLLTGYVLQKIDNSITVTELVIIPGH